MRRFSIALPQPMCRPLPRRELLATRAGAPAPPPRSQPRAVADQRRRQHRLALRHDTCFARRLGLAQRAHRQRARERRHACYRNRYQPATYSHRVIGHPLRNAARATNLGALIRTARDRHRDRENFALAAKTRHGASCRATRLLRPWLAALQISVASMAKYGRHGESGVESGAVGYRAVRKTNRCAR